MLATGIAQFVATTATDAGLALVLAAVVNAEPIEQIGDEAGFNERYKEHPDDEDFRRLPPPVPPEAALR